MLRTHTCGELGKENIGESVKLAGWIEARRDHGGLIFFDLRDRYGLTQIVFNPEKDKELHDKAHELKPEFVVGVEGEVMPRPEGNVNPKLPTGEIEIDVKKLNIFNKAKTMPFEIEDDVEAMEETRFTFRYLDLRRKIIKEKLILKHEIAFAAREYFYKRGFIDIETPILTKSTPEGARDYLVPSRVSKGKFYALPQSPQLFKQICMVAGFDKYFQIAKCFRDEDIRAYRQQEFSQYDIEMSFVEEEDVLNEIEELMKYTFEKVLSKKIETPFVRIPYSEAMEKYGTDSPDLRFGMEIVDVSEIAKRSEFKIFKNIVESGGVVSGINAKGCADFSRKDIDELTKYVSEFEAKGLISFKDEGNELKSSVAKFFSTELLAELKNKIDSEKGDLILVIADKSKVVQMALSKLRLYIAKKIGLIKKDDYKFCWITEMPLFEYNEEEDRLDPKHHPFTSPKDKDIELLDEEPLKVRAKAYDLVLNGVELGGGSIRVHQRELQKKIFKLIKIGEEEGRRKFGFLLDALEFGTPPHGGIALGLDRIVMCLAGLDNIREVIAFPKTMTGGCLMTGAPTQITQKQLKELGLRLDKKNK